jgi:hypothetical protein
MSNRTRQNLIAIAVAATIVFTLLGISTLVNAQELGACDGSTAQCGYLDCDSGPDAGTPEYEQATTTTCPPTSTTTTTEVPWELAPPLTLERPAPTTTAPAAPPAAAPRPPRFTG